MTAYQEGYEDGLAGRPISQVASAACGPDFYLAGYRQGRDRGLERTYERLACGSCGSPAAQAEIVIRVDVKSFLRHLEEQEGDVLGLANLLKNETLLALTKVNLDGFAATMVKGESIVAEIDLKDSYENNGGEMYAEILNAEMEETTESAEGV